MMGGLNLPGCLSAVVFAFWDQLCYIGKKTFNFHFLMFRKRFKLCSMSKAKKEKMENKLFFYINKVKVFKQ